MYTIETTTIPTRAKTIGSQPGGATVIYECAVRLTFNYQE